MWVMVRLIYQSLENVVDMAFIPKLIAHYLYRILAMQDGQNESVQKLLLERQALFPKMAPLPELNPNVWRVRKMFQMTYLTIWQTIYFS